LTSKRVYKEAFSAHKARDIIVGDAGTHFDPDVVKAFLEVEGEFDRIRAAYPDQAGPSILELNELQLQAASKTERAPANA